MPKMAPQERYDWLTDFEVIRDWQRRGLEGMAQQKKEKELRRAKRREERDAVRQNNLIQVFPEYVTPVVPRSTPKEKTWVKVRRRVFTRANGICEAKTSEKRCELAAQVIHHVLPKWDGGKDNGTTPLLAVCKNCHAYIHNHEDESYERGWLVMAPLEEVQIASEPHQEETQ